MRWRLWWLTGLLALAMGILWLRQCGTEGVVAILDNARGTVERDFATVVGQFSPAGHGSRFRVGDGVKTGRASSAVLSLDDGSRLVLDEATLLRFLVTPPEVSGRGLDIETGSATLETGGAPLRLYTSVGLAHFEPGTRVSILPRDSGLRFAVSVGLARFETRDGPRTVAPGDEISIAIGGAVLEAVRPPPLPLVERVDHEPGADIPVVIQGAGVQLRAPAADTWTSLPPGNAPIPAGASLRIAAGSRVSVMSPGGSLTLQGKGQFILGAPDGPFVQATAGRVFVERGRTPVSLAVPGGSITVRPWSKAEASVNAQRTELAVNAGGADLSGAFGQESLLAGESAILSNSGRLSVTGRGPTYADMIAAAGTTFVVHDPSPPTAVGFRIEELCGQGGMVERIGTNGRVLSRSRGGESANILLAQGTHRYQVRCAAGESLEPMPRASGVVTILRDSGTGVLSRVPPMTRIDADGRSYTVMYQNLLPEIEVRWPKAPVAKSYTLALDSRGSASSLKTERPSYRFKAGRLSEGQYKLTFSAGARSSAPTKLSIAFDNAAPTARIQSPQNGSFTLGSSVNVSGVAVPGWGISVAGRELGKDDQSRFSEQVTASPAQHALQVRFSHPRRGVHYYLRHAAGTAL